MFERRRQRLELGLHQPAGGGRQQVRQRRDRRVGTMRRGKGVIDINLAELGQRLGEVGRICFLARVEAQIFEERHRSGLEGGDNPPRRFADAVFGERDPTAAERPPQRGDHRAQRQFRVGPALRPAEMRHDDDRGTVAEQRLDGRGQAFDPGRVGDLAVLDRDVEIGAQQHPLAAHIDIVEGQESGHVLLRPVGFLPPILAPPKRPRL